MPRYYGQQVDPLEMQQMAGNPFYNPELSRPDWYRGIMSLYANLKGAKEEKEAKRISAEDKRWQKMMKEEELKIEREKIRPAPAEKPISDVTPKQIKSLMARLDYPDEIIAEVDSMNDLARRDTWAKLQSHYQVLQTQGAKIPKTPPSTKGKYQLMRLKYAQDLVKDRGTKYSGALTQLLSNPDKAMIAPGMIDQLEEKLKKIEDMAGEVNMMMETVGDKGELDENTFSRLNAIMKFGHSINFGPLTGTGFKWENYLPKQKPKTEAEKKLPEGFTITNQK